MAAQLLADDDDQLLIDSHDLNTAPLTGSSDGVTHARGTWPLESLPCGWRPVDIQVSGAAAAVDMPRPKGIFLSSRAPAREAFARTVCVHGGDVRRAALAALGCCAASPIDRLAYFREKAAIDDASRSDEALSILAERLASGSSPKCVDLGAGTLSLLPTIAKAVQKAGFASFEYLAVDRDRDALGEGLARLQIQDAPWPADADPLASRSFEKLRHGTCDIGGVRCSIAVAVGDALDADAFGSFDLVCGSAFADLVRPEILADALRRIGKPRGTAYLPITFAGKTYLEPGGAEELLRAYDAHLVEDQKQYTDVERLIQILERNECSMLSRASSDWRIPLSHAFAPYLVDFIGCGAVPRFFGGPKAVDAVRWARELRERRTGTLVARNIDLVVALPAEEMKTTRATRSHRRGDSLTQFLGLPGTE